MPRKIYGYVRVSTKEQNEDRQLVAMADAGVGRTDIFMDKQSGKDFDRPEYQKLIRRIKPGDLLYIKSIDRLGRNYEEIQQQWRVITKDKGVDICVIDMPLLDTRRGKDLVGTFLSDIVLQVLSFVAENERQNIRQRQAEGIAAAKARGVRFGRSPKPLPDNFPEIVRRFNDGQISLTEAAKECKMPLSTFSDRARGYLGADYAAIGRGRYHSAERICAECSETYKPHSPNQKYCCEKCAKAAELRQAAAKRQELKEAGTCPICRKAPAVPGHVMCSTCRTKNKIRRIKGATKRR